MLFRIDIIASDYCYNTTCYKRIVPAPWSLPRLEDELIEAELEDGQWYEK